MATSNVPARVPERQPEPEHDVPPGRVASGEEADAVRDQDRGHNPDCKVLP